jgi:hypothetical protein
MSVPNVPASQPVSTPAPEVQSNDEAIGGFARGFLADLESHPDADEPRADELAETPQETEPVETETLEAETPTQPEVPMVEVDIDGEKFNIPEKVKHRVMADKDYRQKTMELSASRKNLETLTATAAQLAQQAQQLAPYHAQLFQMESQAQQLSQMLQSQQLANDPLEYNRVQGQLAILLHNKDRFAQGLQQQVSNLTAEQHRVRQEALKADIPALLQEVPDMAKPETRDKLTKYAVDQGLPQEALDYLNYSASGAKLLWKAQQYDVMVKDQAISRQKLQERTKTLPAATQSSRTAVSGAKDKQAQEQWQKRGGKISDPAFDQILRSKIRGK